MYTLFVARGFPTDKYKTYGIFEFDQAMALSKKGVKVVYAAIDLRSIRRWRKWGISRIKKDGIDVYSINIPLGRLPKKLLKNISVKALKCLYKRIEKDQGKPDIIHAHFTNSAYASSYLKEDLNIPLVVTEHSSKINRDNIHDVMYCMAKRAYETADQVIGVSKSFVERLNNTFNVDAKYIPNIVDTEMFKYKDKVKDKQFTIISTAKLIKLKRIDLVIESFYEAFEGRKDIELKVFGQGEDRKRLQRLISKLNLESQVTLMGLCSREKISKELAKSDLFILASQSETFGVAFIEALATGVPVISTKSGGPEGFINSTNGLLVDIDNKSSITEAMKYMYENIEDYDRKKISKDIKKTFSGDVVIEKIIEVYEKLL